MTLRASDRRTAQGLTSGRESARKPQRTGSRSGTVSLLSLQRQIGNQAVGILVRRDLAYVQRGLLGDMYRFDKKQKAMTQVLASTPQGQHALAVRDQYNIVFSWEDTGAASFDGDTKVYLNQNLDTGVLAGYFIHEMHHVERKKSGASPDADASPQEEEYVDRMVNEEIEGTALSFESRISATGPLMPGEEFYRLAYKNARKDALVGGADSATAEAKARETGRKIVRELIRPSDKSWPRIGAGNVPYEQYYRRIWNKTVRQPATSP